MVPLAVFVPLLVQVNALDRRFTPFAPLGDLNQATDTRLTLFSMFKHYTGDMNWYDVRKGDRLNNYTLMDMGLNLEKIKAALHVQDDGRSRAFAKDMAVAAFLKVRSKEKSLDKKVGFDLLNVANVDQHRDGINTIGHPLSGGHLPLDRPPFPSSPGQLSRSSVPGQLRFP